MTIPTEQITESYKLSPDALVSLYEIRLRNNGPIIRIKDNDTRVWQGVLWESCPNQMSGDERKSDGEAARPTLVIANPYGLFTQYVLAGVLEFATVIRKQVLFQHLEQNLNIYSQRMWKVGRVAQFTSQSITLELRNMTEGPNFMIPARQFLTPDFPLVRLN